MGLFGSSKNELKCKKCGTILPDSERLKKHQEKAHNKKKEKCRACGAEFDYGEELSKIIFYTIRYIVYHGIIWIQ